MDAQRTSAIAHGDHPIAAPPGLPGGESDPAGVARGGSRRRERGRQARVERDAALALMQSPGPESWHPSPEFLFQPGAGPLFDLGPYYLSALATVFGPASRVAAAGRQAMASRVIGPGPRTGSAGGTPKPTGES